MDESIPEMQPSDGSVLSKLQLHPQPSNPAITALASSSIPPSTSNRSSINSHLAHPQGADSFPLSPSVTIIPYSPADEDTHLPAIQSLISGDLSEPYSIYCYRYFLHQWPDLCFIALDNSPNTNITTNDPTTIPTTSIQHPTPRIIGAIVSKLEPHRSGPLRGYIGMLAVSSTHRSQGIATKLVSLSIDAMIASGADEIALETEVSNKASLKLYERLGFLRSKRLYRYYLNGSSAFRLVLYVKAGVAGMRTFPPMMPGVDAEGEEDERMYS